MTDATSLTARWYRAPRRIDPERGYDRPRWRVEGVTITVDADDVLEIRQTNPGAYHDSEMRVTVRDGELSFPLEDLVPKVLERFSITDLAEMITADPDARRAVLTSLAAYYNDHYVEDADRRYWIAKVRSAVHDKALDRLVDAMASIEPAIAKMGYEAMRDISYDNVLEHELRDAGVDPETAKTARHRYPTRSPEMVDFLRYVNAIGFGQGAWNDARDYWRGQVKTLFANIEVPDAEPLSDGAPMRHGSPNRDNEKNQTPSPLNPEGRAQ